MPGLASHVFFKRCYSVSASILLTLVVNIVKVFSDTRLGALALDVCSGASGGGVAGLEASQGGQTSAAESRSPVEQHDRVAPQRVNLFRYKTGKQSDVGVQMTTCVLSTQRQMLNNPEFTLMLLFS